MIGVIVQNIGRFIGLLLFQALILNSVEFGTWVHPMIYPLFILLMPIKLPVWSQMLLGFTMGLCVDMFTKTPGLHASAGLLLAFVRPAILKMLVPRDQAESMVQPDIRTMGFSRFLTMLALLLFIHHLWYFSFEIFNLMNIVRLLIRIFLSTAASIIIITIVHSIFAAAPKSGFR